MSKKKMGSSNLYLCIKPYQDAIIAIILLSIFSVPMLLIAILIVLDSPGASPIFAQQRVGKQGKLFTMYKFRSMYPNAEQQQGELQRLNEMDGPVFKIENDPRITRFGSFLRKTGLDELPQFWNVLRGEMSVVGPRPALPQEVAAYDKTASRRLSVKPGMTGYWQIQPRRNKLSFNEWLKWDLKYLQDCGFLVDWKIMFSTFRTVVMMSGE